MQSPEIVSFFLSLLYFCRVELSTQSQLVQKEPSLACCLEKLLYLERQKVFPRQFEPIKSGQNEANNKLGGTEEKRQPLIGSNCLDKGQIQSRSMKE